MSSSLLKSSSWFLRPQHLKKSDELFSPGLQFLVPPTIVLPEEELFIRECCPVTLGHLLPDLYFTHQRDVQALNDEFVANLEDKFQKHLEDTHNDLSGSSSTMNEDDLAEYSEDCIENDINMHILQNSSKGMPGSKRVLMKTHKVNYPDANMMVERTLLPHLVLNNAYSNAFNPEAAAVNSMSKRERYAYNLNGQRSVFPGMKKDRLVTIGDSKDRSRFFRRRNKKATKDQDVENYHVKDDILERVAARNKTNRSLKGSRSQNNVSTQPPSKPPHYAHYPPHYRNGNNSLCVEHRRTRSLSPFKHGPPLRSVSPLPPDRTNCHIFPSPHLMELARLKKQELELEEKILLRDRRKLELERLKPPTKRWYEIKDFRFHQEAHKNTTYLKNERILPLIQERRRQLLESLMTMDF